MRIAPLLLLTSVACVSTGRGKLMEERITKLENQLEEQRTAFRDRIVKADEKIAQVQKKIDELNATSHRTGADLAVNQDKLQEEVARLKGMLEEEQHRVGALEASLSTVKVDTEGKFAAMKGSAALEDYEAKRKVEALGRPSDKAGLFALAQKQEQQGERGVARELYREFVQKWPMDPKSADAHFRLGEIYFGDKRYREAILSYGKTAEDFPRSDKAPDALYRIAESMVQLDLRDDAKAIFAKVVERYPKSLVAPKAKARLSELSGRKKSKSAR